MMKMQKNTDVVIVNIMTTKKTAQPMPDVILVADAEFHVVAEVVVVNVVAEETVVSAATQD